MGLASCPGRKVKESPEPRGGSGRVLKRDARKPLFRETLIKGLFAKVATVVQGIQQGMVPLGQQ